MSGNSTFTKTLKGDSGFSGFSGYSGYGNSGFSGISGYSGAEGSFGGSGIFNVIVTKSSDYTANYWEVIPCNLTNNDIVITLPTAIGNLNKEICIIRVTSAHTLKAKAFGAETINGANLYNIPNGQWTSITVISNGSNWYII